MLIKIFQMTKIREHTPWNSDKDHTIKEIKGEKIAEFTFSVPPVVGDFLAIDTDEGIKNFKVVRRIFSYPTWQECCYVEVVLFNNTCYYQYGNDFRVEEDMLCTDWERLHYE